MRESNRRLQLHGAHQRAAGQDRHSDLVLQPARKRVSSLLTGPCLGRIYDGA